jgi:hypothetical protein
LSFLPCVLPKTVLLDHLKKWEFGHLPPLHRSGKTDEKRVKKKKNEIENLLK